MHLVCIFGSKSDGIPFQRPLYHCPSRAPALLLFRLTDGSLTFLLFSLSSSALATGDTLSWIEDLFPPKNKPLSLPRGLQ